MKHILFLLLFLPVLAFAQFPANPNKIRLGNQTTADGLVVRTAASPSWTPSSINNAWLAFDTVAVKLYYYDGGTWNEYTGGSVNIGNTDLTLTGNRRLNTGGYQFWIQDGTGAEVPYIYIGGDQVSFAASTTTSVYLDSSEQRAAIVAGAVIDIDADSIRIIGTQPNDNSLNRLLAWDSITNRLHYVDKASITGSGGTDTNFAKNNLTFSGNRVHNLSTRTLTIADGGTYPTFQQSSATDGIGLYSSASDYLTLSPALVNMGSAGIMGLTADSLTVGFTKRTFWTLNGSRFFHQTGGRSASDLGDNLFLGWQAGQLASASATGYANTVIGRRAGYNLNSTGNGSSNTILGYGAGESLVSGIGNTFLGTASGSTTTGGSNTFVGWHAGLMSGGSSNIFMGVTAGENNTASEIIGIGQLAGRYNTGIENIFLGHYAGNTIATGDGNIFIGFNAGRYMDNTAENVIIGNRAGASISNTSTGNNTLIGDQAGASMTSGNNNTFIGRDAGKATTTGGSNTLIGASLDLPDATQSNSLMITRDLYATGVNSSLRMGVGSSTFRNPLATFHVRSTTKSSADTIFAVSGSTTGSSQYENLYVTGDGKTVVQNETATNVALEIPSGDVDAYNDMRVRGTLQVDTRTGAAAKLGAWTSGGLATALVIGSGLTVSNDTITASGSAGVTGSGTTGTISVWSSGTALGNSPLTVTGTDVTASGTGFFLPPIGTTAQRPGSATAGMLRYNTSNGNIDFYGASAWENPVRSTNATGLGTAQYVGFYDSNGRLTGGNAGLRFITSPYPYIQYGQSVNLTDNTIFYWLNGNSDSRNLSNNSGATRTEETGAWRVVATPTGNNAFSNFNGANVVILTGSTHVGGSTIRAGRFEASNTAGAGASTLVGAIGRANNSSTSGATALTGFKSEVVNTAGTTAISYGGTTTITNSVGATLTNTYGWHVGDITSGTQTNTPRSFYAEDPNAINVFNGRTRINSTSGPSQALHVTGKIQADTLTDTGASIAGFTGTSGAGVLTRLALGSGLSLSGGTLTATGTGTTNLAFSGSSSPVTLTSDTGTDVIFAAGSGLSLTQSGGTATYARTYSLSQITVSGGSTSLSLGTAERLDNDTGGSVTTSTVGSDFSVSGSTLNYIAGNGALLRLSGVASFKIDQDLDMHLRFYKEGVKVAGTEMRVSCVADAYITVALPDITVSANTNDTFEIRAEPMSSGTIVLTSHRYNFLIERIY